MVLQSKGASIDIVGFYHEFSVNGWLFEKGYNTYEEKMERYSEQRPSLQHKPFESCGRLFHQYTIKPKLLLIAQSAGVSVL